MDSTLLEAAEVVHLHVAEGEADDDGVFVTCRVSTTLFVAGSMREIALDSPPS